MKEEKLKDIMKYHSIFVTSSGLMKGTVLSCRDCTIQSRCSSCDTKKDQVTSAIEPEDEIDEVSSTINADAIENIDFEIDDSKDHCLQVS